MHQPVILHINQIKKTPVVLQQDRLTRKKLKKVLLITASTGTRMSDSLYTTIVTECISTPAFHVGATNRFFDIELATRTPPPVLTLREVPQHDVLITFLIRIQLLKPGAINPDVPSNLTLSTEHSRTMRALRFPHLLLPIINQQSRAIFIGAVKFLRPKNHSITHSLSPPIKHLFGQNWAAVLGLQQPFAVRNRAPNARYIFLKLGVYVIDHTIVTKNVAAILYWERLVPMFVVGANFTNKRWAVTERVGRLPNFGYRPTSRWVSSSLSEVGFGGYESENSNLFIIVVVGKVNKGTCVGG